MNGRCEVIEQAVQQAGYRRVLMSVAAAFGARRGISAQTSMTVPGDFQPLAAAVEAREIMDELRDVQRTVATFLGFLLTVIAIAGPAVANQILHDVYSQPGLPAVLGILAIMLLTVALFMTLFYAVVTTATYRLRADKNARSPVRQSVEHLRMQLRAANAAKANIVFLLALTGFLALMLPLFFTVSQDIFNGTWSNARETEAFVFYSNETGDHFYLDAHRNERRESFTYQIVKGATALARFPGGIHVLRLRYDAAKRHTYLDDGLSFQEFSKRPVLSKRWRDN